MILRELNSSGSELHPMTVSCERHNRCSDHKNQKIGKFL